MNELWRVQGVTGAVRMMSLDDLDRAFNAGYLRAETYVLAPGAVRWQTLREAAGLDDAPTEPTPSLSPMAIANVAAYQLPEIPQHPPLSFDDEDLAPKKSRKAAAFGLIAVAVAAAGVFAVQTGRLSARSFGDPARTESVAAVAPAPEMKLPARAVDERRAEPSKGLSDETKQRLLQADKAKAKKNAQGKRRLVRNQPENDGDAPIPKSESKPLIEGGDKFDPLNGSL